MAAFARDLLGHKYFQECSGGDRKVCNSIFRVCVCKLFCRWLQPMRLLVCECAKIQIKHNNFHALFNNHLLRDLLFIELQKMEEVLVKSKKEKPTFIPYYVSACKEFPGKFLLGYQPRGKPRLSKDCQPPPNLCCANEDPFTRCIHLHRSRNTGDALGFILVPCLIDTLKKKKKLLCQTECPPCKIGRAHV